MSRLTTYHRKQEEIVSEKQKRQAQKKFRERYEANAKSQQSLKAFNDKLSDLSKQLGTQKAGYEFQDWFYDLVNFCEIPHRRPYNHQGRQIDGSTTLSGTTYLVELKFTREQADANDIDSFFKKVIRKADNTMGIMASISGYSSVALQEASGDRTPLLLLDHRHIYLVLSGVMGLSDVIERVRRHASQTGKAYISVDNFSR